MLCKTSQMYCHIHDIKGMVNEDTNMVGIQDALERDWNFSPTESTFIITINDLDPQFDYENAWDAEDWRNLKMDIETDNNTKWYSEEGRTAVKKFLLYIEAMQKKASEQPGKPYLVSFC